MPIEQQSAEEIAQRLSDKQRAIELHVEAMKAGVSFGRYLELIDPSEANSRMDAFGRQLRIAGIVPRSDPAQGYWASEGETFLKSTAGRALFSEFYKREWNKVAYGNSKQRAAAMYLSGDDIPGSIARPFENDGGPFWNNQFAPAIPLAEIVGITSGINGEDYRSLYMTYDAEALRLFRVGETAEIPTATLTSSQRAIRLRKYGRGLRVSYEALRRTRLDKIAWWIRWQAIQSEIDKVSAALTVLINGDGNSGTAATEYNQSTIDPDFVANELGIMSWLGFRLKFETPYTMTTALMQVGTALQMIMLNTGTANVPLVGASFNGIGNSLTPINATSDGIRYGWTAEAPANKIVGFDKRFAIEQINEIGGDITETERFINNQTELLVMTEVNGFAILDPAATKILDLSE